MKRQRLFLQVHVIRMDDSAPPLKAFDAVPVGGSRGRGLVGKRQGSSWYFQLVALRKKIERTCCC